MAEETSIDVFEAWDAWKWRLVTVDGTGVLRGPDAADARALAVHENWRNAFAETALGGALQAQGSVLVTGRNVVWRAKERSLWLGEFTSVGAQVGNNAIHLLLPDEVTRSEGVELFLEETEDELLPSLHVAVLTRSNTTLRFTFRVPSTLGESLRTRSAPHATPPPCSRPTLTNGELVCTCVSIIVTNHHRPAGPQPQTSPSSGTTPWCSPSRTLGPSTAQMSPAAGGPRSTPSAWVQPRE